MDFSAGTLLLLSIMAAAIPAAVYVSIIYWFDRYEKEPMWLLSATFFWGAVPGIVLALVLNLLLSLPFYVAGPEIADILGAVVVAPPVEETVKAVALVAIFLLLRQEIDSLLDGIIYGAMVGMGFAVVENAFYFVTVYQESGLEAWRLNIFVRAVLFGLNHSLFTGMTGLGLAVSRFSVRREVRLGAPLLGWAAAVTFHALHNLGASLGGPFCLILPLTDWGGVWLLLAIIVWALWQERSWLRTYLKEEVTLGTMTQRQYEIACSGHARLVRRLHLLFSEGVGAYLRATRFYRQCSELAYKKHHFAIVADARSDRTMAQLRGELFELSRELHSP
jgi:RsiW-degrading membrane proteinase PrsW (M82 family)